LADVGHKVLWQPRVTSYLEHGFRASWRFFIGKDDCVYLLYETDVKVSAQDGLTEILASEFFKAEEETEKAIQ